MSNSQRDIVDESPMSPIGSASQINRLVSVDFSRKLLVIQRVSCVRK